MKGTLAEHSSVCVPAPDAMRVVELLLALGQVPQEKSFGGSAASFPGVPQVARYRFRRRSQAAWFWPLQFLPAFIAARDDRSAHQAPIWNTVCARFAEAHAAKT